MLDFFFFIQFTEGLKKKNENFFLIIIVYHIRARYFTIYFFAWENIFFFFVYIHCLGRLLLFKEFIHSGDFALVVARSVCNPSMPPWQLYTLESLETHAVHECRLSPEFFFFFFILSMKARLYTSISPLTRRFFNCLQCSLAHG